MSEFFKSIPKIAYEGKNSKNPLAFKFYNPDEVIAGKTMREQLKFALSWWHTMGGAQICLVAAQPTRPGAVMM